MTFPVYYGDSEERPMATVISVKATGRGPNLGLDFTSRL